EGLGQETLRCGHVPLRREVRVQGRATGGDRPIEVAPPAADPDIGLIHPPGTGLPVRYLPVPPCLLVQLRGVFLDPAVDRGVLDRHAPLGHHFLQIAVAHPVAAVPPHCPQNDVTGEMTTREDTHGCDDFTSLFLLPQLCNSTPRTSACCIRRTRNLCPDTCALVVGKILDTAKFSPRNASAVPASLALS